MVAERHGRSMKVIAFLRTGQDLKLLEDRADFADLKLIALTPEADFSLSKYPKRRTTTEDYYSDVKFTQEHTVESQEKVREICNRLDEVYIAKESVFSFSDIFFYIKTVHDQLLIHHVFCNEIMKKENPDRVILIGSPFYKKKSQVLFDELTIPFLYNFFLNLHGISCDIINNSAVDVSGGGRNTESHGYLVRIRNVLSNFKFKTENFFFRILNFRSRPVFMLQHYDFEVCKKLRRKFKLYWRFVKFDIKQELKVSKNIFLNSQIFVFDNACYDQVIQSFLFYVINDLEPFFEKKIHFYKHFYLNKKIKAVVAAAGQSFDIIAGIKAAHILNIPVVWGQHGGFYGYADFPIMENLSQYYSHYFLYTQEIAVIAKGKSYIVSDSKLQKLYQRNRDIL